MKKFKKLLIINIALVLAFVSLVGLIKVPKADALAPYTCTWTGGGGNSNFSTAGNWSGCNSAAPVATDGDNLVFDNSSLTTSQTLNNDITGLTIGDITFQGSSIYGFTITGNSLTVNSSITQNTNAMSNLNLDITLGGNVLINPLSGILLIGDQSQTTSHLINTQGYSLTMASSNGVKCSNVEMYSALSGGGSLIDNSVMPVNLLANSPSYTGSVTVAAGILALGNGNTLSSISGITVNQNSILDIQMNQNTSYNFPITLNGGDLATDSTPGIILGSCGGGGVSPVNSTATLSKSLTFTANSSYYGGRFTGSNINLDVTGTYNPNGFSLTAMSGSSGNISLPDGTQISPPAQTINYDVNSPTLSLSVGQNITAIVDGTVGDVTVNYGGILKGSGSMSSITDNVGGVIAPGHSPGCLTTSNDLTLAGTYQAEIGGTTACTQYDQLIVYGTVYLQDMAGNSGTLQLSVINGFKPQVGQTFEIINNKGSSPVNGTFANLPEGSTINVNGNVFKISYKGGDGNDVVLTVITAASPNTGFAFTGFNALYPIVGTVFMVTGIGIISLRLRKASTNKR